MIHITLPDGSQREFAGPVTVAAQASGGNVLLTVSDLGPLLLPGFPKFLQRKAAAHPAKAMRSKLQNVGIRPEQQAMMNTWTEHMLDLLEQHFAVQPYLLGGHPTLADFALAGTMYGHLGRDPWPARELIAPRPHLRN